MNQAQTKKILVPTYIPLKKEESSSNLLRGIINLKSCEQDHNSLNQEEELIVHLMRLFMDRIKSGIPSRFRDESEPRKFIIEEFQKIRRDNYSLKSIYEYLRIVDQAIAFMWLPPCQYSSIGADIIQFLSEYTHLATLGRNYYDFVRKHLEKKGWINQKYQGEDISSYLQKVAHKKQDYADIVCHIIYLRLFQVKQNPIKDLVSIGKELDKLNKWEKKVDYRKDRWLSINRDSPQLFKSLTGITWDLKQNQKGKLQERIKKLENQFLENTKTRVKTIFSITKKRRNIILKDFWGYLLKERQDEQMQCGTMNYFCAIEVPKKEESEPAELQSQDFSQIDLNIDFKARQADMEFKVSSPESSLKLQESPDAIDPTLFERPKPQKLGLKLSPASNFCMYRLANQ